MLVIGEIKHVTWTMAENKVGVSFTAMDACIK